MEALERDDWRVPTAVPGQEEIQQIVTAARSRLQDYLLLRLLYLAGLRRYEVVHLLVGDIHWDLRSLFVRFGKDDKNRYVLLDRCTAQLLFESYGNCSPETRLFEHTPKWVNDRFQRYAEATGVLAKYAAQGLRVSPHTLRFAFASHFYDNGLDFTLTSALLGHTLAQDTLHYIRQPRRQLERAYQACNPFAETGGPGAAARAPYSARTDLAIAELEREFASQQLANPRDHLPAVPTPSEMEAFLEASQANPDAHLFFRLLYCSGLWPGHTLELKRQDFHPSEKSIQLRKRLVFLDPETSQLLERYTRGHRPEQPLFEFKEADLQSELNFYASQTGLHQRMQAIQRPFTLESLRFAFAVHCCAERIDPITLMTLMGLQFYGTFQAYNLCAMHRYLPAYDAATPEWARLG